MNRLVSSKTWKVSLWITFLLFLSTSVRNAVGRKCVCTSKACKEAGVEVCRTRFSCYTEEIYDIDGTSRDNSSTRGCTEGATPLLCETNAWTRSSRRGSASINAGSITNELSVDTSATTSRHELLWPRLKCCDTHDYCNSIVADHASKKNDRRVEQRQQSRTKSAKNIVEDENSRTQLASSSSSSSSSSLSLSSSGESSEDRNEPIKSTQGSSMHDIQTGSTRTIVPDFEDRERSYDPLRHRVRPLQVAVVVLAIAALTSVLGACYVITRFLRSPFEVGSP